MSLGSLHRRTQVQPGHVQILVTEVTRMSGKTICVAGIRLDDGRCVRPLKWNGNNWTADKVPSLFQVGALIDGTIRPAQVPGALPHRREDLRLSADPTRVGSATQTETYDTLLALAKSSVQAGLGIAPENSTYVVEGTDCASLFGMRVRANKIVVERTRYETGKVKTRARVGDDYNFPVTAFDQFTDAAAESLRGTLRSIGNAQIILRCGLARPWPKHTPRRCYIQINGFILPPIP